MTGLKEGRDEPEREREREIKRETAEVGDRGARLNQVSLKCRERRLSDSQPLRHTGKWELFFMALHDASVKGVVSSG